jgi:hypothetical protein
MIDLIVDVTNFATTGWRWQRRDVSCERPTNQR